MEAPKCDQKQVAMQFLLDNDVETPSREQQYPMTDLVRTYLQQTGSKFFGTGVARREQAEPARPATAPRTSGTTSATSRRGGESAPAAHGTAPALGLERPVDDVHGAVRGRGSCGRRGSPRSRDVPRAFSSVRISSMTCSPSSVSSALVGSSNSTRSGSFISARPMATRWR